MAKFEITYMVELDEAPSLDIRLDAYYWHYEIVKNSEVQLPAHVSWVQKVPKIQEVV